MARRQARLINAYDIIQHWCKTTKPDGVFTGKTTQAYMKWQTRFRRMYKQCIGPWPGKVALKPTVTDEVDCGDHIRQRVIYDSSPGVTVPAFLLVPKDLEPKEKRPALLASHGHGNGKDDICGLATESGVQGRIDLVKQLNYEYALEAVRRGYVVIAPDWMPFGERVPPQEWVRAGRDKCNVVNMGWQYFGLTLIAQNTWDGMRAVDVLVKHPHVNSRRIGVIGLSYGGTLATHLLINDRRIKAGVVSGYISQVRGDSLNDRGSANTCGAQHVPGLLQHGDIADMLGLAAPKPILCEMGRHESCFYYPDMIKAYNHLRTYYKALGATDRLAKDVHDNDHRWSGAKAWDFLAKWL